MPNTTIVRMGFQCRQLIGTDRLDPGRFHYELIEWFFQRPLLNLSWGLFTAGGRYAFHGVSSHAKSRRLTRRLAVGALSTRGSLLYLCACLRVVAIRGDLEDPELALREFGTAPPNQQIKVCRCWIARPLRFTYMKDSFWPVFACHQGQQPTLYGRSLLAATSHRL